MLRRTFFLMLAAGLVLSAAESLVYVGTYTGHGSDGIYAWRFDSKTGAVKPLGLVAKSNNPSFLAIAPDRRHLYAANEAGRGEGQVSAFSIDQATGALTPVNQVSAHGSGTCFVSVDKDGRVVMVANYGSGSIASFRIEDGGRLSEAVSTFQDTGSGGNPSRQKGPHAHSINPSPDNRFAIAADLGTDKLYVYHLDASTAKLTPNDPPWLKLTPGDGPRHLAFHPNGRWAYVINEIHSTVTELNWDGKRGVLTAVESATTLPAGFNGENTTAEVQVHPSGKWLYGSNRGHDSIAVFEIDAKSGKLKLVQNASTQGQEPRNFRMDPSGTWLLAANAKSNNVTLFRIDSKSGRLTAAGQPIQLNSPVCIKFVPLP